MDESSSIEVFVAKVSPYLQAEKPLLWLCEKDNERPRLLPIGIGQFEAAAIQMQLDRDEPLRPISYDLVAAMLEQLSLPVRHVVIHSMRQSIFYARIAIEKAGQLKEVDSRPSDAVALALRTGAPIYVSHELLNLSGIEPSGNEVDFESTIEHFYEHEPQIEQLEEVPEPVSQIAESVGQFSAEPPHSTQVSSENQLNLLHEQLEMAVICEEYEVAAQLRDEIESIVKKIKT